MASLDLAAIRSNISVLTAATFAQQTRAQVMAKVSAATYGDDLIACATSALDAGAEWLGSPTLDEALFLRDSGINAPIFVALWSPNQRELLARAVTAGIDVSVEGLAMLDAARRSADEVGVPARVHLQVDTGRGRGCPAAEWADLLTAAAHAQADAEVEVVGVWSEMTDSSRPDSPNNDRQLDLFHQALRQGTLSGIVPQVRHLADSAATLSMPGTHFDLVRSTSAVYGRSPVPELGDFGLRPARTA